MGRNKIESTTFGVGNGGRIELNVRSLRIYDGGISRRSFLSNSHCLGNAWDIKITSNSISISESGSAISSSSEGIGDAGKITVNTNNLLMNENGSISTDATQASGGDIKLTVYSLMHLIDSEITSSVKGGAITQGGNITIDMNRGVLQNSRILTKAIEGKGGNIRITAKVFMSDPNSVVSASSEQGIDGEVDIRAPVTNISGSISPLKSNFSSATSLLLKPCAVRMSGGKRSSLVMAGRDGLPFQPGDLMPSPLYDEAMAAADVEMASMGERPALVYGANSFEEKGLLPLDLLEEESGCSMCP